MSENSFVRNSLFLAIHFFNLLAMEPTRIFDLLPRYKSLYKPKEDVLAGKEDGRWIKYTIDQYIETANNISYAFLKLGIQKGDKIATITQNRPEWNFIDMGILQTGAIHVPIYPTISESDYKYILKHAEVKYVFVSGKELLNKIKHILPEIPSLKGLYSFKHIEDMQQLDDLIRLGKENQNQTKLEAIKKGIAANDIATLIYTSGTTGHPKGVSCRITIFFPMCSLFIAFSPSTKAANR